MLRKHRIPSSRRAHGEGSSAAGTDRPWHLAARPAGQRLTEGLHVQLRRSHVLHLSQHHRAEPRRLGLSQSALAACSHLPGVPFRWWTLSPELR